MLCITNNSIKHQSFVYTQLYDQTVLFQTIHFRVSTWFSSIWPIYRTLSGSTTLKMSGPGSDGNEEVLRISQSSSITGTSPSDCLVPYLGHSLMGGVLLLHRDTVGVFCRPSWLGFWENIRWTWVEEVVAGQKPSQLVGLDKGILPPIHITIVRISHVRPFCEVLHTLPLFAFPPWIQLFSLQLWVNSRADWVLQTWWGN